jgi:predicted metal-dependent hydrolase
VTAERRILQFGTNSIPYSLTYSARRHLRITVFPDRRVAVDAPKDRSLDDVERAVRKRSRWIARQRMRFEKYHPLPSPRRYVSGETHRYLGKQYRLRVRRGVPESVKLQGGFLWVVASDGSDTNRARRIVESWYDEHALDIFERRLKACHDRVKHQGIPLPCVSTRKMKTRWGSCRKNGSIVLNPLLIRLPIPCIDYLILHELCHLRVHNHGPSFYRLMDKCLPDWRERRERLNLTAVQS